MEISGIGETTAQRLAEIGVTTFAQIAAFTDEQIASINTQLNLKGSIAKNEWVNQANILIAKAAKQAKTEG